MDSILDCARWLGFEPYKVTATSDYFQQLYELMLELIKKGRAYACHQSPEEMHASRGGDNRGPRTESPYRNRPVEESLKCVVSQLCVVFFAACRVICSVPCFLLRVMLYAVCRVFCCVPCYMVRAVLSVSYVCVSLAIFLSFSVPFSNVPAFRVFEAMKNGEYEPGKATIRLKMDMNSGNPYMWDPVAYRVLKTTEHVRTKSSWVIYPTYDYSHCLVDSLENITHSLCTVEFTLARESYYWVCDACEVYKPVQWEYGRLNITNTVLSKRKLNKLVTEHHVNGWDDPRIYTIEGMRRCVLI